MPDFQWWPVSRRISRSPASALARSGLLLALLILASSSPLALRAGPPAAAPWKKILSRHGFSGSKIGLSIVDSRGQVVADVNAGEPLKPASNQKILTAAAALDELGSDYRFITDLWAANAPVGGVLEGDIIITGGGDPNVSGRYTEGDPTAIFRAWARSLKASGLERVRGDLLVDDFLFDDVRLPPSWKKRYESRWYSAQVGALSLNDNCLDFVIHPDRPGRLARYSCKPSTAYVQIENRCKTTQGGDLTIGLDRYPGSNRIVLKGTIPARFSRGTRVFHVTVDDPGLFFGHVLRETFAAEGLPIEGQVVRDRTRLPDRSRGQLLHRHASTLARDLPVILKNSQNLHAEILLKLLGSRSGKPGSLETGREMVGKYLTKLGIPRDQVTVADGSGLSSENRLSARAVTGVLHAMREREDFELFRSSLAVGGVDGTLERRFQGSSVRGRVFAKTGYINSVSALSGYVSGPEGGEAADEIWSFSILINKFPTRGGLWAARKVQEELVEAIYREIGRGPTS